MRFNSHGGVGWSQRATVAVAVAAALVGVVAETAKAQDSVVNTVHNLSISGPGEIHSFEERQVCKFCHLPHTEVSVEPLWGRRLSRAVYDVPMLRSSGVAEPAPQPDGSSRLCLSCHDGTIALGDLAGGRSMSIGVDRLSPGHTGYIGTDLSGSHAVSFVVPDWGKLERSRSTSDMALRPLQMIESDQEVKLDAAGKMQCTTCHDPHSDRNFVRGKVPHFWVKSTVNEVCLTCHAPR